MQVQIQNTKIQTPASPTLVAVCAQLAEDSKAALSSHLCFYMFMMMIIMMMMMMMMMVMRMIQTPFSVTYA